MNQRYTPQGLTCWIKELVAADNIHGFYICKPWVNLRAQVLKEQHYECQDCKAKGIYTPATTVHHEKPLRKFPWLALTKSNLTALCDECHYQRHHKVPQIAPKSKWNDEKW